MSLIPVYHGTVHTFDTLRAESWVSQSLYEAALHLFLKNVAEKNPDPLSGWVITIPDFDTDMCAISIDTGTVINMMTLMAIKIEPTNRHALKDIVETFKGQARAVFYAQEVVDLKSFIA